MGERQVGAGAAWWLSIPEPLLALLVPLVAATLIPRVRLARLMSLQGTGCISCCTAIEQWLKSSGCASQSCCWHCPSWLPISSLERATRSCILSASK